jgi:hypothetical protein
MVIKYITPGGSRIHGPPYTEVEQADLYRRTAGGPVTFARAGGREAPKSPKQQQPSPANVRKKGDT